MGFEAGGPESIALPEFSQFVSQGDVAALKRALLDMLDKNPDRARMAREAGQLYSGERMAGEYMKIYKELAEEIDG